MAQQNSYLKSILSPTKSGTFFAPFRSRSANPDGFDAKMKLWMNAIEEWMVRDKRLTLSLNNIHQTFISDNGIRPDKECLRLVISEMKRQSRLVPMKTLRTSSIWSSSQSQANYMDNLIDPSTWLGWGVKKFVYNPAAWALSSLTGSHDQSYSDLTDMSIGDDMRFVCLKSLTELSHSLFLELVRISKAERQSCFEWHHLLELITPIMNSIIDATDSKEVLEMLDVLLEYLAVNKMVAIKEDDNIRLVKIANQEESREGEVVITQKDIATARLLRAKELIVADIDKYLKQAQSARSDAIQSFNKQEVARAKSSLRSYKRLNGYADRKEAQLRNVEELLDQLENTDSNMMILQAYKQGAEALALANTEIEANMSVLDDAYDATAEANYLNEELNRMTLLANKSFISNAHDISDEAEYLNNELSRLTLATGAQEHETPKKVTNPRTPAKDGSSQIVSDKTDDDLIQVLDQLPVVPSGSPNVATKYKKSPAELGFLSIS